MKVNATNWNDIVLEISKWKSKRSVWDTVRRLCFAAAVCHVWQERNRRVFGNADRSKDDLFKILELECEIHKDEVMKDCLISLVRVVEYGKKKEMSYRDLLLWMIPHINGYIGLL
ncbi:hypothetical protein Tco_1096722 [Tanacetum coccineum]